MRMIVTPTNVTLVVKWAFCKRCRADKKVEGTTNQALEDVTNEGLLLMAQNEDNINNDTL